MDKYATLDLETDLNRTIGTQDGCHQFLKINILQPRQRNRHPAKDNLVAQRPQFSLKEEYFMFKEKHTDLSFLFVR